MVPLALFVLYVIFPALFLFWMFGLEIIRGSLLKNRAPKREELLNAPSFFYYPFHRQLFPKKPLPALQVCCRLGGYLATIGYSFSLFFLLIVTLRILPYKTGLVVAWLAFFAYLFLGLLLGLYLPRRISARLPGKGWKRLAPFSSLFLFLSFPLTGIFAKIEEKLRGNDQNEEAIEKMEEVVHDLIEKSGTKGTLGIAERTLILAAIKFKDRIVREVMVPRLDLFALPMDQSIREAASAMSKEGYSRCPVFEESMDNIIGVLMFKDILEIYMDCESGKRPQDLLDGPIQPFVKPPFYTPETKRVAQLLQEFRTKQVHMAIVVDEYGGTEGVVTIEDLLEEIVGEIEDEYDLEDEALYNTEIEGKCWRVDARMSLIDVEEHFGVHIPKEGEYDTIGGYLFHKTGKIPPRGSEIVEESFSLEVLRSTARSVERVRLRKRSDA